MQICCYLKNKKDAGDADLLFIDKMIMREVKMRKRNLSMAWIDYKTAYDMVPHPWIIDCLETVGMNEKIRRLLAESTKSWRVELRPRSLMVSDLRSETKVPDSSPAASYVQR